MPKPFTISDELAEYLHSQVLSPANPAVEGLGQHKRAFHRFPPVPAHLRSELEKLVKDQAMIANHFVFRPDGLFIEHGTSVHDIRGDLRGRIEKHVLENPDGIHKAQAARKAAVAAAEREAAIGAAQEAQFKAAEPLRRHIPQEILRAEERWTRDGFGVRLDLSDMDTAQRAELMKSFQAAGLKPALDPKTGAVAFAGPDAKKLKDAGMNAMDAPRPMPTPEVPGRTAEPASPATPPDPQLHRKAIEARLKAAGVNQYAFANDGRSIFVDLPNTTSRDTLTPLLTEGADPRSLSRHAHGEGMVRIKIPAESLRPDMAHSLDQYRVAKEQIAVSHAEAPARLHSDTAHPASDPLAHRRVPVDRDAIKAARDLANARKLGLLAKGTGIITTAGILNMLTSVGSGALADYQHRVMENAADAFLKNDQITREQHAAIKGFLANTHLPAVANAANPEPFSAFGGELAFGAAFKALSERLGLPREVHDTLALGVFTGESMRADLANGVLKGLPDSVDRLPPELRELVAAKKAFEVADKALEDGRYRISQGLDKAMNMPLHLRDATPVLKEAAGTLPNLQTLRDTALYAFDARFEALLKDPKTAPLLVAHIPPDAMERVIAAHANPEAQQRLAEAKARLLALSPDPARAPGVGTPAWERYANIDKAAPAETTPRDVALREARIAEAEYRATIESLRRDPEAARKLVLELMGPGPKDKVVEVTAPRASPPLSPEVAERVKTEAAKLAAAGVPRATEGEPTPPPKRDESGKDEARTAAL